MCSTPLRFGLSADATRRIERAEQFFGGLQVDIREGGSRAFYSPAEDYIQMPPFAAFKKADFRYSVLAHEITHWTGATTRLNRNLAPRFQKEAYAAEELIAELGSAFICAELELEIEPRRDHAPYIQSWLNVLRHVGNPGQDERDSGMIPNGVPG